MDALRTLASILLIATLATMPRIDAAIDIQGYAKFHKVKSARGLDPSCDSNPGNKVHASKDVCEEANKSYLVNYNGDDVGGCMVYIVNTYLNPNVNRVWYMTRCPGSSSFYVKNVGTDMWSVFYP